MAKTEVFFLLNMQMKRVLLFDGSMQFLFVCSMILLNV